MSIGPLCFIILAPKVKVFDSRETSNKSELSILKIFVINKPAVKVDATKIVTIKATDFKVPGLLFAV